MAHICKFIFWMSLSVLACNAYAASYEKTPQFKYIVNNYTSYPLQVGIRYYGAVRDETSVVSGAPDGRYMLAPSDGYQPTQAVTVLKGYIGHGEPYYATDADVVVASGDHAYTMSFISQFVQKTVTKNGHPAKLAPTPITTVNRSVATVAAVSDTAGTLLPNQFSSWDSKKHFIVCGTWAKHITGQAPADSADAPYTISVYDASVHTSCQV